MSNNLKLSALIALLLTALIAIYHTVYYNIDIDTISDEDLEEYQTIAESLVLFNYQPDKQSILDSLELDTEDKVTLLYNSEEYQESQMYLVGDSNLDCKITNVGSYIGKNKDGINTVTFKIDSFESNVFNQSVTTLVYIEVESDEITLIQVKDYVDYRVE